MLRRALSLVMLTIFLASILTLAFRIQQVKSQLKTWIVDDDGPADFHTIQEAINAAADGDTIFVRNGIYYENIVVNKTVSLIGENKSNTIIDGNGTLAEMGVVWLQSDNSSISGFTIRNGAYGIRIFSYNIVPRFSGHRIEDNCIVENLYGGIFLMGCANNTISNNIVRNNTLFGIHLYHAGNNALINNTVANNGHGITFYGNSHENILRNNNMTENTYNFGPILRGEWRDWIMISIEKLGIINDVDVSNTVNGKPIYYLVNQSNVEIPLDAGYVSLNNCTNITVTGCNLSHNLQGVLLLFCNNVSVINNNIVDNVYGIYVGPFSGNNTLIGNRLEDNLNGIYLDDYSRFTTMRNDNISGGNMNFGFSPDIGRRINSFSDLENDIDDSNTVNGKPIIYWVNKQNQTVPKNAGYVMLINSSNILIEDLNLSNNFQGIFLLGSNNTVIANNTISHSTYGIDANYFGWIDHEKMEFIGFFCSNITIKGNIVNDNSVGILAISDNSTISNNTLYRNPLGIVADINNGTISRNMIIESNMSTTYPGLELFVFYYPEWPWEYSIELAGMEIGGIFVGGEHNVIYGNTVKYSHYGLAMHDKVRNRQGFGNLVFHNNFIDNLYQAIGPGAPTTSNDYDNGYPCGGNYWSNYNGIDLYNGPYQNETGSDGVGDTSFIVFPISPSTVIDNYPLMAPIEIFDVEMGVIEIVSNSSRSYFNLNVEQKILSFNVTGTNGETGFCRLTISNVIIQELWQENYTVYFDGKPLPFRSWKDEANTYIYINYTHSEHKITIVPEFSSAIILPSLMVLTTLSAIFAKGKMGKQRSNR